MSNNCKSNSSKTQKLDDCNGNPESASILPWHYQLNKQVLESSGLVAAAIFGVIVDEVRHKGVCKLFYTEIGQILKIGSINTIKKHAKILIDQGLIATYKPGRNSRLVFEVLIEIGQSTSKNDVLTELSQKQSTSKNDVLDSKVRQKMTYIDHTMNHLNHVVVVNNTTLDLLGLKPTKKLRTLPQANFDPWLEYIQAGKTITGVNNLAAFLAKAIVNGQTPADFPNYCTCLPTQPNGSLVPDSDTLAPADHNGDYVNFDQDQDRADFDQLAAEYNLPASLLAQFERQYRQIAASYPDFSGQRATPLAAVAAVADLPQNGSTPKYADFIDHLNRQWHTPHGAALLVLFAYARKKVDQAQPGSKPWQWRGLPSIQQLMPDVIELYASKSEQDFNQAIYDTFSSYSRYYGV